MSEPSMPEPASTLDHTLTRRLREGRVTPDQAAAEVCQALGLATVSPDTAERLRADAEAAAWYAPMDAWALAVSAHTLALALAPASPLAAACALTLGITLNAGDRFADAVPALHTARDLCRVYGQPTQVSRCDAELAYASAFLGDFDTCQTALARARAALAAHPDPLTEAHCDRAEGLFKWEQTHYSDAASLLHQAADRFLLLNYQDETVVTWCFLADALRVSSAQQALKWVNNARQVIMRSTGNIAVLAARCDYVEALIHDELNRYSEGLALYERVRAIASSVGNDFLVACCDQGRGVSYYRVNEYAQALTSCVHARNSFAYQGLHNRVAICNLNIALIYYGTNRYTEALILYQEVANIAYDEGRVMRAARCYANMGLCYIRLGRYNQALALQHQAYEAFLNAGNLIYATLLREDIARTYCHLGRHQEALDYYQEAAETFSKQSLPVYMARCKVRLADLYLNLNQYSEALACLAQARETYTQTSMPVEMALCDREMARILTAQNQEEQALTLTMQAKAVFADKGLVIDNALCDLVRGEAYLGWGDVAQSVASFEKALTVLEPGFPDEAWRAEYGLGRCALAQGEQSAALAFWLAAVALTQRTRASLTTERLSGGFFADRQPLYTATLRLALDLDAREAALAVAEAGKAQTFLTWAKPSRWRDTAQADPSLAPLLTREADLRRAIETLRSGLRVIQPAETGPILRGQADLRSDQPDALAQLKKMADEYEAVVERLRLAGQGEVQPRLAAPFSLAALRDLAGRRLPPRWAGLAYYFLGDSLVIFYVDATHLTTTVRRLTPHARLLLRQCTTTTRDFRELVYRGTLRGQSAPAQPGQVYLRQLYDWLVPSALAEPTVAAEPDMLVIAPHGPLHALPFHALPGPAGPLGGRAPMVTVPSLDALHWLMTADHIRPYPSPVFSHSSSTHRTLVCGLSDFGTRASPLAHAEAEVAAVRGALGQPVDVLWGDAARRETLLRWSEEGRLMDYAVIHFVTHAILDRLAPSQSRILLADDNLTLVDILTLRLDARLVVLAACDSAGGERQSGDEIMGLAQAFFQAGARTVVASLWPIEDEPAVRFMRLFYQALTAGRDVVQAVQAAQQAMRETGYVPYHWAPFVTIGLP